MIFEKFSSKAFNSIVAACRIATKKKYLYVTTWHLLYTIINDKEKNLALECIIKSGTGIENLSLKIKEQLNTQPKKSKYDYLYFTPINIELEEKFILAEKLCTSFNDKFISLNHIIIAMLDNNDIVSVFGESNINNKMLIRGLFYGL